MDAGVKKYVYEPEVTSVAIAGQSVRFPVRRIYCVGRNYVDHIREMKEGDERDPPFFFQKPARRRGAERDAGSLSVVHLGFPVRG